MHKKLEQSIIHLTTNISTAFWGEFLLYVDFIEKQSIPTAGVCFKGTLMKFYYNKDFIDKIESQEQVNFLMFHEVLHLLCSHNIRGIAYNRKLSNIAMDMIINSSIVSIEGRINSYCKELPNCYYIPKEYTGKPIFEHLYQWLKEQEQNIKIPYHMDEEKVAENDGKVEDDGVSKYVKHALKHAEMMSGHCFDIHLDDDIPPSMKDQIIQDIKNGIRVRGIDTANIDSLLEKLSNPKKNYLKEISISINRLKGSYKKETISRPHRRLITGMKGRKLESKSFACLLDVSGSMDGWLETVLSFCFLNDYEMEIVQCDAEVKKSTKCYCKKDVQNLHITGLGGTVLQPGIDYISKNFSSFPLLILTDGICDQLDLSKIKQKVLIISCGNMVSHYGKNDVKQILIDANEFK